MPDYDKIPKPMHSWGISLELTKYTTRPVFIEDYNGKRYSVNRMTLDKFTAVFHVDTNYEIPLCPYCNSNHVTHVYPASWEEYSKGITYMGMVCRECDKKFDNDQIIYGDL